MKNHLIVQNEKFVMRSVEKEKEFLKRSHEILIHPKICRHLNIIKKIVFITTLKQKISKITTDCIKCNTSKHFNMNPFQTTGVCSSSIPYEKMSVDIKGLIPTHRFKTDWTSKSFYILVVVNRCSRICRIAILKSIRAKSIINGIKNCQLCKCKKSDTILSDQGSQFSSMEFKEFIERHEIKHIMTSPYNPRCNGRVERVNRTIGEILRLYSGKYFKKLHKAIHTRVNYTWNRSIKEEPITMPSAKTRRTVDYTTIFQLQTRP